MWLTQFEPESILRPNLNLIGNVAPKCPGDLQEPDDQLCPPENGTDETEISKVYGTEGTHKLTH